MSAEPDSLWGLAFALVRLAMALAMLMIVLCGMLVGFSILIGGALANISSRLILRQLNHERVHAADARAIQFTRLADGLREALQTCHAGQHGAERPAPGALWQHICRNELGAFVGPARVGWREAFVRVHPGTEERLARLNQVLPSGGGRESGRNPSYDEWEGVITNEQHFMRTC